MPAADDVTITAVPNPPVAVGYNYPWPWNKYGIYLGSGDPPGSDPSLDVWVDTLRDNLVRLKEIGVAVVRIFLLGNAANLGSTAPGTGPHGKEWRWNPPDSLHEKFTNQLRAMFQAFQRADMKVLPSLLDFAAICSKVDRDPDPGKNSGDGFRNDIVMDSLKGDWLLDKVFDPFLQVSSEFRAQVFAWEIMNEPYWATVPTPLSPWQERVVAREHLARFLTRAIQRANDKGFDKTTVGHRFRSDFDLLPTGSIRQFHYYPKTWSWRLPIIGQVEPPAVESALPPHAETNAIVGEFAASLSPQPGSRVGDAPWPDVDAQLQERTFSRVLLRLRALESKGYTHAFIWPEDEDRDNVRIGPTDPIKLSRDAQSAINAYTHRL